MNWDRELALAVSAVRGAAELLSVSYTANAYIQSQAGRDIKTRADMAAEESIIRLLTPSGLPVLAEESAEGSEVNSNGLRWLVDPLDGTMNFSRHFPVCGVSIGLWHGMMPVLGAIYDLGQRSLYTGIAGQGAWCNGQLIKVSATPDRAQSILATGFPVGRDFGKASLDQFMGRVQTFKKIRMLGSAALSLARVAEGVFDSYYEEDIMIWDVAAGLALVVAAGGTINVRPGRSVNSLVVSATNGKFAFES